MGHTSNKEGRGGELEAIARRHEVPVEAAEVLLAAIRRGGGRQAQFSHSALGGMGQWSRGGGIMIGDMFDHALKAKVERLCAELADLAGDNGSCVGASGSSGDGWWPSHLGHPSAVGSQNEEGYACFPEARRLAIRGRDGVRIFDTADHRITGVSQQQSGTRDLVFTSQYGSIRQSDLTQIDDEPNTTASGAVRHADRADPSKSRRGTGSSFDAASDVLGLIERLYELQRNGILTQEEYAAKKTELLGRL